MLFRDPIIAEVVRVLSFKWYESLSRRFAGLRVGADFTIGKVHMLEMIHQVMKTQLVQLGVLHYETNGVG